MRALAILTQRNEGAFLLEWLAHHRAVGFTDFLVLSNDCQDGSDQMLDRLAAMGQLSHLPNPPPYDAAGIQFTAMKRATGHPLLQAADWIAALDIDEFVNIHLGDRSLGALLAALPEASAITLTWRLFGNAGVVAFEDRPVTAQFTRAAPSVMHWPWRAAMFKTLWRNDGTYAKPGIHRPRAPDPARIDSARWFDGAGRELPASYRRTGLFSPYGRRNDTLVQLNHYPLGAMESYILKADRGRAVHADQRLGMDYWVERNFCTDADHTIAAIAPRMQAELAALSGLPVFVQNDATAACGAELVFGTGDRPKDFLYFYFGTFIGGGLVLNGQLFTGRSGNAAGVGPMPVPGPDGKIQRLFDTASMSVLADTMERAGQSADHLWAQHEVWHVPAPLLDDWLDTAARGLAHAILSAAALIELEAVLIDGWMPTSIRAALTARTHDALHRLDLAGIDPPAIREGTVGANARVLGAAAIPLSHRYLLDQNA